MLTVDMPVLGIRERDLHSGFVIGHATGVPNVSEAGASGLLTMPEVVDLIDPSLTWEDVAALARGVRPPGRRQGRPDAGGRAARGARTGPPGVVVSNHGGRQLDTVLSGADALPAVVDEVGGEIDVIVDGGIRRGADVLKALALGAQAVLVGRPVLWGLAVEAGRTGHGASWSCCWRSSTTPSRWRACRSPQTSAATRSSGRRGRTGPDRPLGRSGAPGVPSRRLARC